MFEVSGLIKDVYYLMPTQIKALWVVQYQNLAVVSNMNII